MGFWDEFWKDDGKPDFFLQITDDKPTDKQILENSKVQKLIEENIRLKELLEDQNRQIKNITHLDAKHRLIR